MYQRLLLTLIPLSFVLHAFDVDPRIVFVVSLLAIVPVSYTHLRAHET